jgi:hypothetical protein
LQDIDYDKVYKPKRMHVQPYHLSLISKQNLTNEGIDYNYLEVILFAICAEVVQPHRGVVKLTIRAKGIF